MTKKVHSILIVDDEVEFLELMGDLLSAEGYEVVSCSSGKEAVEQLEKKPPFSVIISDHRMPAMKGTELLATAKRLSPHTPRIMVTAYQSAEMMEDSINKGEVFRFLTKPIDIELLLEVVRSAICKYETFVKEDEQNRKKDEFIQKLKDALELAPQMGGGQDSDGFALKEDSKDDSGFTPVEMLDMISALSNALDIINPALNEHHKRTCYIASCLAAELALPTKEVSTIFLASILHDIGAIVLADRFKLLNFEDKSPHAHAELGALLLESFHPFAFFAPLVRFHHVPWENGKGAFFKNQSVPQLSHLIHLADRIAVLVTRQTPVLKQVKSICEKISSKSGEKFIPEYVNAFLSIAEQEAFWLDIVSHNLDHVIKEKSQLPAIPLDLNGMEELARFFSTIIDTRSHFTANHSSGVSASAMRLAELLNMTSTECHEMRIAGYLHDLGKLAVPETIIEKPGQLNNEERDVIKSHTYHTYSILKEVKGLKKIAIWASFHHETLTGEGYPFHRSAKELPLGSRIMTVADIFTALTEDRPYRKGMEKEKVVAIFSEMVSEGKIDKKATDALINNYDEMNKIRHKAQKEHDTNLKDFWGRSKELSH
jgi:response regulator RpfG family c-di-GMP phosphodiesterase